ncbi:hypothetical protein CHIBITOTORO_00390 [Serratia phage vB_SmaM-ChibiTotoro]|nr:hypothetical protein CHIBITOTORO_00390 [Serratia phage vB_SmaM-ChibiTotoro]
MSFAADLLRIAKASAEREKADAEPKQKREKREPRPARVKPKRRIRRPDMSGSGACQPWDIAANDQLRKLTSEGLRANVIAARMGRTPAAIKTQASRIGLSLNNDRGRYHKITPEEKAQIVELYYKGHNNKTIGSMMGLTENQVRGQVTKLCDCNRHHAWTRYEEWMLVNYHPAIGFPELAEIIGIKPSALRSRKILLTNNGRKYELLKQEIEVEHDKVAAYFLQIGIDPASLRTIV